MAYEAEEVRLSQEIFYHLLEHHELREAETRELYRAYTESAPVQEMVKAQGRIAASRVKPVSYTHLTLPTKLEV